MPDNADAIRIDVRKTGQRGVAVRRDVGQGGKRLKLQLFLAGVVLGTWKPERQSDETVLGQLIPENGLGRSRLTWFPGQASSRFGPVERDDYRGKGTFAIGNQQDRGMRQAGGHFDTQVVLREVLAAFSLQVLDSGFLDQWRPRPHDLVPTAEDFLAANSPVRGRLDRVPIVELQR